MEEGRERESTSGTQKQITLLLFFFFNNTQKWTEGYISMSKGKQIVKKKNTSSYNSVLKTTNNLVFAVKEKGEKKKESWEE